MDAELQRRLENAEPPFDGVTLMVPDMAPLPAVRAALSVIVEALYDYRPDAPLFTLHDWHEHDECVSRSTPTDWTALRTIAATDDALWAAQTGDTYVRLGFFPVERDYYLRIYVVDEHDSDLPGQWANFDLTGDKPLIERVSNTVRTMSSLNLMEVPASDFFFFRHRLDHPEPGAGF